MPVIPSWSQIKEIAGKAPQSFVRFSWGALFLFAAAALVAAWSGGKLATLILVAVIIFGFAIAILGFDRLARNPKPYYAVLGGVFITVIGTAIVALVVTVFIYLGTGWPPWLDTIFKLGPAPATPSATASEVRSDSAKFELRPFEQGVTVLATLSDVAAGDDKATQKKQIESPQGDLAFGELKAATKYTLHLLASRSGRTSAPFDLTFYTAALETPYSYSGVDSITTYTGPVTDDGAFTTTDRGIVRFHSAHWPVVLEYTGRVTNGLPVRGSLKMTAEDGQPADFCGDLENDINPRACANGSCSDAVFANGALVTAGCDLTLAWVPVVDSFGDKKTVELVHFLGSLGPAGEKEEYSVPLGPFRLAYSGNGHLDIPRGKAVYEGQWKNGRLDGQGVMVLGDETDEGTFHMGVLVNGEVYSRELGPGWFASYETANASANPKGMLIKPDGFSLGTPTATVAYSPGYTLGVGPDEPNFLEIDDPTHQTRRGLPAGQPDEAGCLDNEDFGQVLDTPGLSARGVSLISMNRIPQNYSAFAAGEPQNEVQLDFRTAGIRASIWRWKDSPAGIRFVVDGQVGDNVIDQRIAIDGHEIDLGKADGSPEPKAPLALARLCSAKKLTNLRTGATVAIDPDDCRAIAVALARAYFCDPGYAS